MNAQDFYAGAPNEGENFMYDKTSLRLQPCFHMFSLAAFQS